MGLSLTEYIRKEVSSEIKYLEAESKRDHDAETKAAIASGEIDIEAEEQAVEEMALQADEEAFDLAISTEPLMPVFEDPLDYLFGAPGSRREADAEPF